MNEVKEVTDAELADHYKFARTVNKSVEIDAELFKRYEEVKRQLYVLEGEEKFLANKIKAQMKDRAKATVDGKTVITWVERDYPIFDRVRLKIEKPEVYNEYAHNEPRRFFWLESWRKKSTNELRKSRKARSKK